MKRSDPDARNPRQKCSLLTKIRTKPATASTAITEPTMKERLSFRPSAASDAAPIPIQNGIFMMLPSSGLPDSEPPSVGATPFSDGKYVNAEIGLKTTDLKSIWVREPCR